MSDNFWKYLAKRMQIHYFFSCIVMFIVLILDITPFLAQWSPDIAEIVNTINAFYFVVLIYYISIYGFCVVMSELRRRKRMERIRNETIQELEMLDEIRRRQQHVEQE